jgi:hypothetical protein
MAASLGGSTELREFSCGIFSGQDGSERGKLKSTVNIRYQETAVKDTAGSRRVSVFQQ